jgi:hypothetical protein
MKRTPAADHCKTILLTAVRSMPGAATLALAAAIASVSAPASAATAGGIHLQQTMPAPRPLGAEVGAKAQKPVVYAASYATSTIFVFDQSEKSNAPPKYTIKTGLSDPNGMAVDTSGNLYVTNELSSTITIYTPGGVTPIETITTGVNTPFDVAVDSVGDMYVANDPAGQTSYLNFYPNGTTAPSYTWYPPVSSATITGIALLSPNESDSIVYATYYAPDQFGNPQGDVMECYTGIPQCSSAGYMFGQTAGIAIASPPFEPSVPFDFLVSDVSAPGIDNILDSTKIKLFPTPYTPWYLAFNANHKSLFVATGGTSIVEYSYPGMKQRKVYTGSGGSEGPHIYGVAVSPSGAFI